MSVLGAIAAATAPVVGSALSAFKASQNRNKGGSGVSKKLPAGTRIRTNPFSIAGTDGTGLPSGYEQLYNQLQNIQAQNNAWSAAQAQKQMDFQSASADKAMKFNADQAEISRKWQEYMSDTAHQREVKDMVAAGINPVLSATGGSGAAVTSGATASGYTSQGAKGDTDTSLSSALVSLFSGLLQSQTALANQALSAQNNIAVAEKYTAMQETVSRIQQQTQYGVVASQRATTLDVANINSLASQIVAKIHAGATVTAAQYSAEAAKVSASIHAAAQRYGYDVQSMTSKQLAGFNAELQKELKTKGFNYDLRLQRDRQSHEVQLKQYYPSSMWQTAGSLATGLDSALSDLFGNPNAANPLNRYKGGSFTSGFGGSR